MEKEQLRKWVHSKGSFKKVSVTGGKQEREINKMSLETKGKTTPVGPKWLLQGLEL